MMDLERYNVDLEGRLTTNGKIICAIPIGEPKILSYFIDHLADQKKEEKFQQQVNNLKPNDATGYVISYKQEDFCRNVEGFVINEQKRCDVFAIQFYRQN